LLILAAELAVSTYGLHGRTSTIIHFHAIFIRVEEVLA
jgi:hypothetical protein